MKKTRDRSSNKPGYWDGLRPRHKCNPAGSKVARMAQEKRITTHTTWSSEK